jgi:hypothetical protein
LLIEALGELDPGTADSHRALNCLERVLKVKDSVLLPAAIASIGHFGAEAANLLPQLDAMRASPNIQIRNAAQRATSVLSIASGTLR